MSFLSRSRCSSRMSVLMMDNHFACEEEANEMASVENYKETPEIAEAIRSVIKNTRANENVFL
jgi:hypothetical protein